MSDKKGLGCCGIGCIVLIVIALIIIGVGVWARAYFSKRVFINKPAEIENVTQNICDYTLPDTFTPMIGGTLFSYRGALFADDSALSNAAAYILEIPETNITSEITQSINMQISQQGKVANASQMITRSITITNGFGISTQAFQKIYYTDTGDQTVIYYDGYTYSNRTIVVSLFSLITTNDQRGIEFLESIGPPKK